jgi:triosephosphate isomerase
MRKNIVAGNWKMNKNLQEGIALAKELNEALAADKPNCDVVICTPFIHLASVTPIVDKAVIGVGAENCADKVSGAYTGISAEMIVDSGCTHVIIGHSERRQFFGENNWSVNQKVKAALDGGLVPIICVGEMLEDREADNTKQIITDQLVNGINGLPTAQISKSVIAYEPVWAIGTGKTASPDQAQEVHALIRSVLAIAYSAEVAESIRIQYGGSVINCQNRPN